MSEHHYQFTIDRTVNICIAELKKFRVGESIANDFSESYQLIQKLPRIPEIIKVIQNGYSSQQFYKQVINLLEGDYYEVGWDINHLLKTWQIAKPPLARLRVDELIYDGNFINLNQLANLRKQFPNFEPLIAVEYAPLQQNILIDGNHRALILKENKVDYTDTYLIQGLNALNLMRDPLSKSLFLFHYNITAIYSMRVNGNIECSARPELGYYFPLADYIRTHVATQ
jgi:hypothetical protein